jgi:hypothetical protein
MSQFIQRIANYVANEVIIKGLAHSKTFQRFAVRTDAQLKEMSKQSAQQFEKVVEENFKNAGGTSTSTSAAASAAGGPPRPPLRGFPGFVSCFFKEIRKDLTGS